MFGSPTLKDYRRQLERLKKYRAALGMDESVSLQLLIDEAKHYLGEK